jgi:hypothetical protein
LAGLELAGIGALGALMGRRCLLQRTLYDEQALTQAAQPNNKRIRIDIPP